jgi:hypothetical protein
MNSDGRQGNSEKKKDMAMGREGIDMDVDDISSQGQGQVVLFS